MSVARLQHESSARLERGRDRLEKCGVAVVVEIAEAVAETEGTVKSLGPWEIAHFALLPVDLAWQSRGLTLCRGEKVGRDVDRRHVISAAGQNDAVPTSAARHIEYLGRRRHIERFQDEIGLVLSLFRGGSFQPEIDRKPGKERLPPIA